MLLLLSFRPSRILVSITLCNKTTAAKLHKFAGRNMTKSGDREGNRHPPTSSSDASSRLLHQQQQANSAQAERHERNRSRAQQDTRAQASTARNAIAGAREGIATTSAESAAAAFTRPPPAVVSRPASVAISLSGCGFLCSYHIGAMICFQRHAQTLLSNVNVYCGASAGALVASLMVLAPQSLEAGLAQLFALAEEVQARPFGALTPGFNMAQRLAGVIDAFLPEDIAAANGRLAISVTRIKDRSNRLILAYSSRDYLIQCLNATCYIPYYSSSAPPILDGEAYMDGVYSNNLPVVGHVQETITISPFSGSATIAPRDRNSRFDWQMTLGQQRMNVNIANVVRGAQSLFPQSIGQLTQLYRHGYTDAMLYLLDRGFYEREEGTAV